MGLSVYEAVLDEYDSTNDLTEAWSGKSHDLIDHVDPSIEFFLISERSTENENGCSQI